MEVNNLSTIFGILGNIVSFLVYLAPAPTFYRICKKKSTEGFQSIPYAVALFSAMLYLYYAYVKECVLFLITINTIGSVIEITYLIIYVIYATKESGAFTIKVLVLFNGTFLGFIIACMEFGLRNDKHTRETAAGWICAVFSVCVFASPLSIMRQVIRTKSVEFMPFTLSFFLTLCATMWFFYGLLIRDYFIATPNVMGFAFGIIQMILYVRYKNPKQHILPETKVHNDFTSTIVVEIKEVDESREISMNKSDKEREVEIVVIDQVPGILVVQPNRKETAIATECKG